MLRPHYPEKVENGVFTRRNKRNNHRSFWICVWGKIRQGNHIIIVTSSFSKSSVLKMFSRPHWNAKPVFPNSSGLKSIFEKLRFRDGLVWTVGLTVEIKLRFQISAAYCRRGLRSARTRKHIAGTWSRDKPLLVYAWDACCKNSTQAGAHEADVGSFPCCSGDSLREQCTRCDIENWRSFVPA